MSRNKIINISSYLDILARCVVVLIMLLVVCNVILRFFGCPLQGTYEWVGMLTALATAMALAYCGAQAGHVAVTIFIDCLKDRVKILIEILSGLIVLFFLVMTFRAVVSFAETLRLTGEVSLTTGLPFYPIVYIIAFGVVVFCLVALVEIIISVRKVVRNE